MIEPYSNQNEQNVYIEQALQMAEAVPGYTQKGVIITSVFSQFKHHKFYNSLLKIKTPSQKASQIEKMQIRIPRVKKTILNNQLPQPIYDGTSELLAKVGKNNSFSCFPLCMTYLFSSIKNAKIVLVIDSKATIDTTLNKVKDTLLGFAQSINIDKSAEIVKAVAIMIIDSQFQMTPRVLQRIKGNQQGQSNEINPVEAYCSRIQKILKSPINHPQAKFIQHLIIQIIKNKKISFCKSKTSVTDLQRQGFQYICSRLLSFPTQNACVYQHQNFPIELNYTFMYQMWPALQNKLNKKIIKPLIDKLEFIINPKTKIPAEDQILKDLQKSLQKQLQTPNGMEQLIPKREQFMVSKIQQDKPTRDTQRLIKFYLKMKAIYRKICNQQKADQQLYKEFIQVFFRVGYISNKSLKNIISNLFTLSSKMKDKFLVQGLNSSIAEHFFPRKLDFLMENIQSYLDLQISKFSSKKKSEIVDYLAQMLQQLVKKLEEDAETSKILLLKMYRRSVLVRLEYIKGLSGNVALIQLIRCEQLSRKCDLFQDSQHYRKIYERIGDCLLSLQKYDKAILFYEQGNSFWKIQTAFEKKLSLRRFFEFRITKSRATQFNECIEWMIKLGLEQQSRKLCYMCLEIFETYKQQEMFNLLLNRTRKTKQEHLMFLSQVVKNTDPKISEDELTTITARAEVDLANRF